MRAWLLLLGGMLVWTVHFFGLYILASLFGTAAPARIGTGLLTLGAVAANLLVILACLRVSRDPAAALHLDWPARAGAILGALSIVAVIWQGLPALTG